MPIKIPICKLQTCHLDSSSRFLHTPVLMHKRICTAGCKARRLQCASINHTCPQLCGVSKQAQLASTSMTCIEPHWCWQKGAQGSLTIEESLS